MSPRRITRVGRQVAFRVRVQAVRSGAMSPLPGAVVRLAGARAVTKRDGRAILFKRFGRRGAFTAIATARGYAKGRATVLVVKRRTQAVAPSSR